MADYKLSHTAAEIDDKLSKIQTGGTGYTEGETIHPIDPKYLPGVCLPVVEITSFKDNLTDSEKARLDEVMNEDHILVSLQNPSGGVVMKRFEEDGVIIFVGTVGTYGVSLAKVDGTWMNAYEAWGGYDG